MKTKSPTTLLLLDRWKVLKGLTSDNAAALKLGITRASVSGWRNGRSHAEARIAAKMAADLKLDVLAVLAAIEADRATDDETRRLWARFGKGAFMSLVVGIALATGATPRVAQAATPENVADHYAHRHRRRALRIAAKLAARQPA